RERKAPRLRGVGGADLARGARAGGEGRRHGRGTQAEATAGRAQYPFTVAWVREAIESLGGQYVVPPEAELQSLVNWLNPLAFIYTWEGRPKVRDSEVRNALRVLARYHEDRWTELLAAAPHLLPRSVSKKKRAYIVGRETQVRDKFNAYSEEMIHLLAYELRYLPMDVAALDAPFKSWHNIAAGASRLFSGAMKESNPGKPFGNSDRGHVVRFTTAVLNLIGILPHADRLEDLYPRVAKHLRMNKAEDQKKIGRQALAVKAKKRKGKQGLYETRKRIVHV